MNTCTNIQTVLSLTKPNDKIKPTKNDNIKKILPQLYNRYIQIQNDEKQTTSPHPSVHKRWVVMSPYIFQHDFKFYIVPVWDSAVLDWLVWLLEASTNNNKILPHATQAGGVSGVMVIVCWKWTRRTRFKTWTRLFAFVIVLIPLGKAWLPILSPQLLANYKADYTFQPWFSAQSRRRKTLN